MSLGNVRSDRKRMILNMLLIERAYGALEYHNVPYDKHTYFTSPRYVKSKMIELRKICKENDLQITERLLNHAIKYGASEI